jgi:DNA-directed RNA polymerase sigma subunit (sigma70/sigma32)
VRPGEIQPEDCPTLREVGEALGLCGESVRQIQRAALRKVEAALRERLGDDEVEALRCAPKRPS